MAAPALPLYGHRTVKMPHLARLAEGGTVFDNAYCNFPLCVPSRASMLAGRYANAIGVWDNAAEMSAATPTVAHCLRALGYHTVLCGKMHFIGPDQVHGFDERIVTDIYPSNFAWTPDWIAGERYRPTGINMRAVVDSGICVRGLQIDYDEEVEFAGVQKLHDLARFNRDSPFMLWVSFTHPHSPYITTREYWERYADDEIDMPAVPAFQLDEMDVMSRWLHYAHGGDLHEVTDEHIRTARHAYYGMCSYVDDKVGRLLDTVDALGLGDDTVIIFTSDHGEMLGERGMWFKQAFYEWSARVPLIVNIPGLQARERANELVSLVDLLPTMLDVAGAHGAEIGNGAITPDGHSLLPLMARANKNHQWDNSVISEYTGEGVVAPCRMARRDNCKFIHTHGHPDLLYDLSADPQELTNRIGDPAYAKIESDLRHLVLHNWDPHAINAACLQSQKDRLFIQQTTGGNPNWAYQTRTGDGERYIRNDSAVGIKAKARYPFVEPTPFIK